MTKIKMAVKYTKLKTSVIDLLKEKNQWEEVDETLVDEFVYNVYIGDKCKEDIVINGVIRNVAKEGNKPYFQANQAVQLFQSSTKISAAILTKLGITPQERKKLKINTDRSTNLFDELGENE